MYKVASFLRSWEDIPYPNPFNPKTSEGNQAWEIVKGTKIYYISFRDVSQATAKEITFNIKPINGRPSDNFGKRILQPLGSVMTLKVGDIVNGVVTVYFNADNDLVMHVNRITVNPNSTSAVTDSDALPAGSEVLAQFSLFQFQFTGHEQSIPICGGFIGEQVGVNLKIDLDGGDATFYLVEGRSVFELPTASVYLFGSSDNANQGLETRLNQRIASSVAYVEKEVKNHYVSR